MDVKWIKLMTDMFDNRKIRYLRKLPDGNSIVLIWVMLLSLAGRCNAGGMIHLTRDIPYTPKMLADELDFEENTVTLALTALENLGMISLDPLVITNWEEYQCTEKLDQIREQNRLRKQKQRALEAASRDSHVTVTENVTQCHATDIDIEEELEREKENIYTSLSERKKEKRKKDGEANASDEAAPVHPMLSVFRSALEREYKKLSPEERQNGKDVWAGYMETIKAYLDTKPDMGQNEAENTCRMLDWLYHGDVEGWIGMMRCRGGQE